MKNLPDFKFLIFWIWGKKEIVIGKTIIDALQRKHYKTSSIDDITKYKIISLA